MSNYNIGPYLNYYHIIKMKVRYWLCIFPLVCKSITRKLRGNIQCSYKQWYHAITSSFNEKRKKNPPKRYLLSHTISMSLIRIKR